MTRGCSIEEREDGVILKLKVIPGSSRNSLIKSAEERLVIKLTSPPIEGKANKQLIKFLGKKLGIAPSSISILRGNNSRDKVMLIAGLSGTKVKEKIGAALGE